MMLLRMFKPTVSVRRNLHRFDEFLADYSFFTLLFSEFVPRVQRGIAVYSPEENTSALHAAAEFSAIGYC